jgi:hypothetical protein
MEVTVSMGTPTVSVTTREYMTMEHLWTARHAARLCSERESQILGQETPDTELRSFTITSIFLQRHSWKRSSTKWCWT